MFDDDEDDFDDMEKTVPTLRRRTKGGLLKFL